MPRCEKKSSLGFVLLDTCLGWMGVVGSSSGLSRIILPQEDREAVVAAIEGWGYHLEGVDLAFFGDLPDRLRRYLGGEQADFPDRLCLAGRSRFQQSVWEVTRTIPYGETRSYGWVARQLGIPKGARAVGQALGRNPLPVVIPCHRVISTDGGLGGFSGGLEMKRYLLRLEKQSV